MGGFGGVNSVTPDDSLPISPTACLSIKVGGCVSGSMVERGGKAEFGGVGVTGNAGIGAQVGMMYNIVDWRPFASKGEARWTLNFPDPFNPTKFGVKEY